MKKLKFVKIKCQCGYTNLIPAYENIKCEKCRKVIIEPKEQIRIVNKNETLVLVSLNFACNRSYFGFCR